MKGRELRLVGLFGITAATAWSEAACADCELGRPTTDGGSFASSFEGQPVETFDSARLRVHFVRSGPAAVWGGAEPGVPPLVSEAAAAAEVALDAFADWGFRAPLSDAGRCPDDGGDGRIDLYLVDFGAGDGQAPSDACESDGPVFICSGYLLMDARPTWYDSEEEAARVVVVHEIFHLVQKAYVAELDGWFAEGTAQWAADRLTPSLTDMESFFPAFYEEAHRSIDNPPGGVATGFLYGSAIFPLYLDERFGGPSVVLAAHEQLAAGLPLWGALEAGLEEQSSSLTVAYPEFALWLATTGDRQGVGGFSAGLSYPTLGSSPLPPEGVTEQLSGFGIRAYELDAEGTLELDADASRVRGWVAPLDGGAADLSRAATLPASLSGPSLVVVTGITPQKSDAAFSLRSGEPPTPDPTPEPDVNRPSDEEAGCTVETGSPSSTCGLGGMALALVLLAVRRSQGTRARGRP